MDTNQSYFVRTNWFIWIGFTSSMIMILLVGFSLSSEWEGKKQEITKTADYVMNALLVLSIALSFWLQVKIKRTLFSAKESSLAHQGKVTLLYTLFLLSNEVFVGIGFYYGFMLNDTTRFYFYGLGALLCNALTPPSLTLRGPRIR